MLTSIEGVFQDGTIKLMEPVPEGATGRVIVTFITELKSMNLQEREINIEDAADLRFRLSTFAEDWLRPEMDVYDVD
jgi:hypothetical protein